MSVAVSQIVISGEQQATQYGAHFNRKREKNCQQKQCWKFLKECIEWNQKNQPDYIPSAVKSEKKKRSLTIPFVAQLVNSPFNFAYNVSAVGYQQVVSINFDFLPLYIWQWHY